MLFGIHVVSSRGLRLWTVGGASPERLNMMAGGSRSLASGLQESRLLCLLGCVVVRQALPGPERAVLSTIQCLDRCGDLILRYGEQRGSTQSLASMRRSAPMVGLVGRHSLAAHRVMPDAVSAAFNTPIGDT